MKLLPKLGLAIIALLSLCSCQSTAKPSGVPDWFISSPAETKSQYIIPAEGMTQDYASKQAIKLLSQRLLTKVKTTTLNQTSKVNDKQISEFKEKSISKGIEANFPAPDLLKSQVNKEALVFYGLFAFNKQSVKNVLIEQYNSLYSELQPITTNSQSSPFKCSLDEKQNEKKLTSLKEIQSVIAANWKDSQLTKSKQLFTELNTCFQNRRLMLSISPNFALVDTHIAQVLADWNTKQVTKSAALLNIDIKQSAFTRFGQSGIKLEGTVKLVENGTTLMSERISASGYNPKSTEKALENAQLKFIKQIDMKVKNKLRSI